MTAPVIRAGLIGGIGCLALLAPVLEWGTALLFGAIAIICLAIPPHTRLFELLARPGDRDAGRLYGVGGFSLSVTALAILGTIEAFSLSMAVFIQTVLIVSFGNFGETAIRSRGAQPPLGAISFVILGTIGSIAGWGVLSMSSPTGMEYDMGLVIFFASLGGLIGALCRTDFYRRDDPVVLLTIGLILWFLAAIMTEPTPEFVFAAFVVTGALGGLAYIAETASVAGMLSGTIVGYVTVVLAGFHWFILLLTFFGVGGLATKYRYNEKLSRGVAERHRGARGTGNVLGNSLVAVIAVVGYVMAPTISGLNETILAVAFGGAVATALADTMSSEIGSLQDNPILITTFDRVQAGTDGAVTVFGSGAGVVGSAIVAMSALAIIPEISAIEATILFLAGVVGMFADSFYGATLEDRLLGNQGVNLLATASGAVFAVIFLFIVNVMS